MRISPADDAILALGRTSSDPARFRETIAEAVRRHPALGEARANAQEAEAGRRAARQALYPSFDVALSNYRVLAREFSNDPENIVERSRANSRTDATLGVQQTVIDFGATRARIAAAGARIRAAGAGVDEAADDVALRAIDTWYQLFGFRALVALGEAFLENQRELRRGVEVRIAQGVAAPGDLPRVDSYIASAGVRLADYRRGLADAEARFTELFGTPAPRDIQRAPLVGAPASLAAQSPPAVRAAEALAEAARRDARAARAETAPSLSAGIDAGRYGVFENERDYDIRARVTLRMRLFGGVDPQADQIRARASAVEARAARIREEAERDASIAASDVTALEAQLASLQESYLASRQSRDVLAERFRVARGSLFDLLAAQDGYFEAAVAYIRAVTQLDSARYVLLARTGRLLPALSITPDSPASR